MKRLLIIIFLFLTVVARSQGVDRPRLVIGIVVDQMRWDYLYRYYDHFGPDGFKRLMNEGFRCEQAFIDYLPSYTAPGHACIYTGSVPAIHGITGNLWYENGKPVYCTEDKSVKPVGGSKAWGQMSPRNLLTTTVTDELRLATNFRSSVYSISLKDRSSILPGGHLANGAFWYDDSTGTFTTSSYYGRELPGWVAGFNAHHPADSLLSKDWTLLDPRSAYVSSAPDSTRYEGKFLPSEPNTGFPHLAKYFTGSGNTRYTSVRKLPVGNWLTLQFAKRCIEANRLGQHGDPDFLCISLSSTDYAGHQFGPNAIELEDMYVRLDRQLARLFEYLDQEVGEGEYTVFLTADHGAAHNSLYLEDHNVPAGNVSEAKMMKELNAYLHGISGEVNAVISLENYQVYFNPKIGDREYPAGDYKDQTIEWLKNRPEVATVIDLEDPRKNSMVIEQLRTMAANGYYGPRCGSVQIILKPGYYTGFASTGTTHGTWNPYDTHIPLLWYGWGIRRGETNSTVHMTDIAATVSALLHIQMPNGCVGKVITGILP